MRNSGKSGATPATRSSGRRAGLATAVPTDLRRRASQMDHELTVVGKLQEIRDSHLEPEGTPFESRGPSPPMNRHSGRRVCWTGIQTPRSWHCGFDRRASRRSSSSGLTIGPGVTTTGATGCLRSRGKSSRTQPAGGFAIPNCGTTKHALEQFARSAPIEGQSVPFLLIVGRKIDLQKGDAAYFLKRSATIAPQGFRDELPPGLSVGRKATIPPRALAIIRPRSPSGRPSLWRTSTLGTALGRPWPDRRGLEEKQIAVRLSPESGFYRHSMPVNRCSICDELTRPCQRQRRACELEPHNALFLSTFGRCLAAKKEYGRSIGRAAAGHRSGSRNAWQAHRELRDTLLELHQLEKAHVAWRKWLAQGPRDLESWDGYAELSLFFAGRSRVPPHPHGVAQTLRQHR